MWSKYKYDDIIWLNLYNIFSISDVYLCLKEYCNNKWFFLDKMWLFYVVFIVEKWNEVKYFRN